MKGQNNAVDIDELRLELNRLRIAADNIERLITVAEEREEQERPESRRPRNYSHTHPVVRDRDGRDIIIGDQVIFLTHGLFSSDRGTVYKVLDSGARITAHDQYRRSISRAPLNLHIVRREG